MRPNHGQCHLFAVHAFDYVYLTKLKKSEWLHNRETNVFLFWPTVFFQTLKSAKRMVTKKNHKISVFQLNILQMLTFGNLLKQNITINIPIKCNKIRIKIHLLIYIYI